MTIKVRCTSLEFYAETDSPELAAQLLGVLTSGVLGAALAPSVRVASPPQLPPAPARGRRARAAPEKASRRGGRRPRVTAERQPRAASSKAGLPEITFGPGGKRVGVARAICTAFSQNPKYSLEKLGAHIFHDLDEPERTKKLKLYISQLCTSAVLERLGDDQGFGLLDKGLKTIGAEAE